MASPDDRQVEPEWAQEVRHPGARRDDDAVGGEPPLGRPDSGDAAADRLDDQCLGPDQKLDPGRQRASDKAIDDAVLIGPAIRRPETGADEPPMAQDRPAQDDLVGVEVLTVDPDARLK